MFSALSGLADLPLLVTDSDVSTSEYETESSYTDERESEYESDGEQQPADSPQQANQTVSASSSGVKRGFLITPRRSQAVSETAGPSSSRPASANNSGSSSNSALRGGFFNKSSNSSNEKSNSASGSKMETASSSKGNGPMRSGFFNKPSTPQVQHRHEQPAREQQEKKHASAQRPLKQQQPQQQQQPPQQQQQRLHPSLQQPNAQQPPKQQDRQQSTQQQQQQQSNPQRLRYPMYPVPPEWQQLFKLYERGCSFCLRPSEQPDEKAVSFASELLALFKKHPDLERTLSSQLRQMTLNYQLNYHPQLPLPEDLTSLKVWLLGLLWNVILSGTVQDVKQLCGLSTLHQYVNTWMTLSLPQVNFISKDKARNPKLPTELTASTDGMYLWEGLIRHKRWEVFVEGAKQWPAAFPGMVRPPGPPDWMVRPLGPPDWMVRPDPIAGKPDVSPFALVLQHLLYADAPASVFAEVLHIAANSRQPNSFDGFLPFVDVGNSRVGYKTWFLPPGLMAAEGVMNMKGRNTTKPDALSLAVQQNKLNVVEVLLRYFAWPGAFVPEGVTDVDAASATKTGWWFDSSAIWAAGKHGDENMLNLLLGSINKSEEAARKNLESVGREVAAGRIWLPAVRHNIDAVIEGCTPLALAIRACNINLAKVLLAAGADPLTVCSSSSGPSSGHGSTGSAWTTPLHLAVEKNMVKLLLHMAPTIASRKEVLKPKAFGRHKQSNIWNSEGETPLVLAVRLKHDKAACAMLSAGFKPLQLASVHQQDSERDDTVHALLLAVKAVSAGDTILNGFLQQLLSPASSHSIKWDEQLADVLSTQLSDASAALLVDWLSQQPLVVASLTQDEQQYIELLRSHFRHAYALRVLLRVVANVGTAPAAEAEPPAEEVQQAGSEAQTDPPKANSSYRCLVSSGTFLCNFLTAVLADDSPGDVLSAVLETVQLPAGLLRAADKVTVHPSKAAAVARWLPQLLELGLPSDCKDPEGQTPLSHMLLPLGISKLQPLLDTNHQHVISNTDQRQWKQNLLHAAVALQSPEQRAEAVAAIAAKAAEQGWTHVFTAKSGRQQVAATMCKNAKLRQIILAAEAQAKHAAAQIAAAAKAAKEEAEAVATAAKAAAAAAEQQQQLAAAHNNSSAPDAAAAAESAEGKEAAAVSNKKKRPAELAGEQLPGGETARQRKERMNKLLGLIPVALQGAAAPAEAPPEELQQQQRLSSAQKAARDVALVRSRIASLAPEQLPDKDVSLSEGVIPGVQGGADTDSVRNDRKGRRHEAVAVAASDTMQEEFEHQLEDEFDQEDDMDIEQVPGGTPATTTATADAAELAAVNEDTLSGLPWEFIITREAFVEWGRLEEQQRKLVILRLKRIGLGTWQSDGTSKRLRTNEPGLELWRTKITKGGRIIWQIAVDYSTERKCWLDMIRLWAIRMTHDPYARSLNSRSSILQTIIASHRRSQQVRKRLQLRQLNLNATTGTAGPATAAGNAVEGQRLPAQYQPLLAGDDNDDVAAGVLPEVAGGVDATAVQIARLAAAGQGAPAGRPASAGSAGQGQQDESEQQQAEGAEQLVVHLPPANGAEDVYTLLKMYTISAPLVRAVLRGQSEEEVDFPFRVSDAEMRIIEMVPRPPSSILLLGRSGTGKTTVLVFRLFAAWLTAYQHTSRHLQAVFVTASATLKEQVSRTFRKLQAATITDPADAAAVAAATANEPTSLVNLAPAAFPLFTTTRQWLMLLDASVAQPFFARGPDGRLVAGAGAGSDELGGVQDWDGIGLEVDLQGWTDDADEDYSSDDESEEDEDDNHDWEDYAGHNGNYGREDAGDYAAGNGQEAGDVGLAGEQGAAAYEDGAGHLGRRRKRRTAAAGGGAEANEQPQVEHGYGQHYPSREITYADFVSDTMWAKMTKGLKKEEKVCLKAPLVYAELMSYIKGSAEALEAGGHLSLEQYLELGAKRAPNFSGQLRRLVYRCYEAYEAVKSTRTVAGRGPGWDRADLAAALYRNLRAGQYLGVRLDGMYRDEVQDFTQAELLLDLRLCSDPNSMFYCGDTCQTIARGVGFRFEDVKTLMYHEGKRRADEGIPGPDVGMPKIEVLTVNYRTHAGILDAASSITALLRACFPRLLDKLPRERAFFNGPRPLLLDGLSTEELSILLSSGDPNASQVEFGAHQVVLVRDMEARERLPAELKASNALIMTVGQSKGLEFDDVFLVDFCADSPACAEWRVLLQLLQGYEETVAEIAKYYAAVTAASKKGSTKQKPSWTQLVAQMSAEDLRAAVRRARSAAGSAACDVGAGAAIAAAERDELLLGLPGAAVLTEIADASATASEAGGWLRPLKFDPEQHSLLCEELKHLYVAITRAKNNLVVFDRDGQKRAPLYQYLRRLGLATHVTSVTRGLGAGQATAAATDERSTFRGSMSNSPVEWVKRARNLVEMKLFQLAAQCYGCAGDVMRAAAYGAMQLLHDLHTSAQETTAASSAATGKATKSSATRTTTDNTTKAKRHAILLSAADVLLTCAVHGGATAAQRSQQVTAASIAAITAAAERAGLPVPSSQVEGAIAPPVTPAEQMMWLRLTANAFRQAGWQLEAGRLLLGFGPEFEEGRYWALAKKLLKDLIAQASRADTAVHCAVAAVFEQAARQEMGATAGDQGAGALPAVPSGLHGSFVAASRLLKEALELYRSAGRYSECWRMLRDYEGLKPLIKDREVDSITLAWIEASIQSGNRETVLSAINSLRDMEMRKLTLRKYGFFREFAAIEKDPVEAARVLAEHGEYQAAAERYLADPAFLERATVGQMRQVHGWLLRVGTAETARKAVQLWESLQQYGRLGSDITEGTAAAQLNLARLLLRQVVGATLPRLEVQRPVRAGSATNAAGSAGAGPTEAEKENLRKLDKKERRRLDKEKAKERKRQQKAQQAAGMSAAVPGGATDKPAEGAASDDAPAAVAVATLTPAQPPLSYAAAAARAADNNTQTADSSSNSASKPQAIAAAAAAALGNSAPIPTACLAKLQQRMLEEPAYQEQVTEARRALSDAQAAFTNCQQPAGALEALSWALAAKPAADITTAQFQVTDGSGAPDVLRVIDQSKQAVELLQALASVMTGGHGRLRADGLARLSPERKAVCLSSLERFYGIKQLADNQKGVQPLEFRDESVMFIEALAALDNNPGQHLITHAVGTGQARTLVPYGVAVRAMAAHLYKHTTAALARCMRSAVSHVQQLSWLTAQVAERRATSSSSKGNGSSNPISTKGNKAKDAGQLDVGLDVQAMHKELQQAAHVMLLALSAHSSLRDAGSVLRSSQQLDNLAFNEAVWAAEALATQLSTLLVALEFPAIGPSLPHVEYQTTRGTAGAMPVVQGYLKTLPINKSRQWLDICRQLPLSKVADQISQLCPYDPAAALWVLRVSCYKHMTVLRADMAKAQSAIQEHVVALKKQWAQLANRLMYDPDAYQVMLEVKEGAVPCIDTELLLKARAAFSANEPSQGCSQLLLLLERSIIKEQLAAGLLAQQPVAAAGETTAPTPAAGHDESAAPWSKVRPLPPDVALQLLEATAAAALIGLGTSFGGSQEKYIFLPETARNQVTDPVIMAADSLQSVQKSWSHGPGGRAATQGREQAANALSRCLRVCFHLASVNWNIGLLPDDKEESGTADADAAAARPAEQASRAVTDSMQVLQHAGALHTDPSLQQLQQRRRVSASGLQQKAAVRLVFAEHLAALAAGNFESRVLYAHQAQQHPDNSAGSGTGANSSSHSALGGFTAAAMPVLAAKCALLLGCIIASLGVLESSMTGQSGASTRTAGPLMHLLLPAVTAAKQMVALAVDLAQQQQLYQLEQLLQQQKQPAVECQQDGTDSGNQAQQWKPRPGPHWIAAAVAPLKRLLDVLQPPDNASVGVTTRSKAAGADKRVQLVKWCEALLGLAKPLGVELVQVATIGAVEREFHGFSSKPVAQMPKGEKALATASIVCNLPPSHAAASKDALAVLQLPSLAEVHLNKRLSPAERQALADKAKREEELVQQLQEGRLRWLRANPAIRAAVRKLKAAAQQRLAERKAQEAAAKAAEAAAAAEASAAHGASEDVWLPPEAYLAWGVPLDSKEGCESIKLLYGDTEIGRVGTDALRRAHRVGHELAALEEGGNLSAAMCPVCKPQHMVQMQQQQAQVPGQEHPAQHEQQSQQQSSSIGLSAAATSFVPHKVDGTRHEESLAAYKFYMTGIEHNVMPVLRDAARVEWWVNYLQHHAEGNPELQLVCQRIVLLKDKLVLAARRLFEDMQGMLELRDWRHVQEHTEHLESLRAALIDTQRELANIQSQGQQQQQPVVYSQQQLEAQMFASASQQQQQQYDPSSQLLPGQLPVYDMQYQQQQYEPVHQQYPLQQVQAQQYQAQQLYEQHYQQQRYYEPAHQQQFQQQYLPHQHEQQMYGQQQLVQESCSESQGPIRQWSDVAASASHTHDAWNAGAAANDSTNEQAVLQHPASEAISTAAPSDAAAHHNSNASAWGAAELSIQQEQQHNAVALLPASSIDAAGPAASAPWASSRSFASVVGAQRAAVQPGNPQPSPTATAGTAAYGYGMEGSTMPVSSIQPPTPATLLRPTSAGMLSYIEVLSKGQASQESKDPEDEDAEGAAGFSDDDFTVAAGTHRKQRSTKPAGGKSGGGRGSQQQHSGKAPGRGTAQTGQQGRSSRR